MSGNSPPPGPKRLPRNAAPIPFITSAEVLSTSPGSYQIEPQPSLGQSLDIPTRSPSGYSEIEVVLDDGTLQKRTVSLSTLPDPQPTDDEDDLGYENNSRGHPSGETLETTPLIGPAAGKTYHTLAPHSPSSTSNEESDSSEFFPNDRSKPSRRYRSIDQGPPSRLARLKNGWKRLQKSLALTPERQLVLKCSFAYFLGSLFTFVPALNAFIGNNRVSSHLVATATVFFNPAKTLGGMVEAAAYGWGYTLFALTVCLGSMVTTDFFIDQNMYLVAHLLSLLFWLAGATFIVSFLKAHWNKPPVATASSLCFIIIFIIVVREGSANRGDFDTTRIEQITSAVAMGTVITVSSCILFWPSSAARKLKKDLEATLMSYRVLLKLLTKTFLLDDDLPEFTGNKTLQTAINSHRASFTALQKSLKEAKLELMWNVRMRASTHAYEEIVQSMQRLAQHVGGLRSSCGLQFDRINKKPDLRMRSSTAKLRKAKSDPESEIWSIRAGYRRRKLEHEMRRQKTLAVFEDDPTTAEASECSEMEGSLVEFIGTIRQPLKSLAYTCKQTICHLQQHFSSMPLPARHAKTVPSFDTLENNLQKAIALFEVSQRQAVQRLQRRRLRRTDGSLAPGEDIFLVYFFVFNMIEFAREMISLVQAVKHLEEIKQNVAHVPWWHFWSRKESKPKGQSRPSSFGAFVPNERHMTNTLHTPEPATHWRKFILRVWRTFSLFKTQKVRYATKATIATILLAAPAFIGATGDWFRTWRMEWALITLMVVMTPTVGGTNIVAIYRIFSTILGCFTAMFLYMAFPGNMYVLPVATWLFSIPNFWLILNHKHGKFGQFTLLAYNLVMLNKYNDRDTNNVDVWVLALQRCGAIMVGVVFGLIATAYVWPYEARVELRKGLSDFLLRLAWLYQKLVSSYSARPQLIAHDFLADTGTEGGDEHMLAMTTEMQRQLARETFMDMELGLQRALLDLQALLAQTPNEPRLKGPFPTPTYRAMIDSCQNIVDKFLSMRTVILKDAWFEDVQRDFIMPVSAERREMVGNVLLYFYLLASALRLKTPLPPYFPPARDAWQRLIVHLRELPVVHSQAIMEKEHIYVFYYAYVTMMEDIIRELDKMGDNMTQLFGALVPADQWEHLFETDDPEQGSFFTGSVASNPSHM